MASLTSCQFESVLVNHVSYNPVLLLNISITGVHSVSSLQQLAARQDSLFLLSYTPFHVTQFTSKEDILVRLLSSPVQLTVQVARPAVASLATTGLATLYLSRASPCAGGQASGGLPGHQWQGGGGPPLLGAGGWTGLCWEWGDSGDTAHCTTNTLLNT